MLARESIKKFKNLYKQRFKEKLSDQEAFSKANRLLNLYRSVYGLNSPNQQKESERVNKNENYNYYEPTK